MREQLGYNGVVLTDWGLVTDTTVQGKPWKAKAWGVRQLSELQRVERILDTGCDQFGGEARPDLVVELVKTGVLSESRVDTSVRKLLCEKFLLGLFDQPFVNMEQAAGIVGNPYFKNMGLDAQRRSHTLLTNKNNTLPLLNLPPSTRFTLKVLTAHSLPNEIMRSLRPQKKLTSLSFDLLRLQRHLTQRKREGFFFLVVFSSRKRRKLDKQRFMQLFPRLLTAD